MITPNIAFYARFGRNNTLIKRHGEMVQRKVPRYDLQAASGAWTGFGKLQTAKGDIYLNLIPSDKNPNRSTEGCVTEYYLQTYPRGFKGSFNLSGLRLMQETEGGEWYCSGEPSTEQYLKNGAANPLYDERNDGFVFVVDKGFQWVELWVIAGARYLIDGYRKAFQLGTYAPMLEQIREAALCWV